MNTIKRISAVIIIVVLALILCLSCTKKPKEDAIQTGPLNSQSIHFQYAIYYLPIPSKNPSVELLRLLTNEKNKLRLVDEMEEIP